MSKEIKTINVAGKTYAVGLFWQPLQDQKKYLEEVKQTVQNVITGANLFCLRKGAVSQYGLGYTSKGHKSGMPSAASVIAAVLRDKSSALCAFKIDDGWWFVVIRNGLILSEEDTIYTEEQDVKAAYETMLNIPDWGYMIAPKEWGYENTHPLQLEDLIVKGKPELLKTISEPIKIKDIIILLVLVAFGLNYYLKKKAEKEAEEQARLARIREEEYKRLHPPPPPPPPPPAPFEVLVDVEDMAKKCAVLIVNSTVVVPGWNLENSNCTETMLSSSWNRTYGNVGWIFESQKQGYLHKDMKLSAKDTAYKSVVGNLAIPIMKRVSVKPIIEKVELQKRLNDIFKAENVNVQLTDKKETVKGTGSYLKEYPYTAFTFDDSMVRLPLDWVRLLKEFKAVSFDNIFWDNKTRKWKYNGRIYELTPEMIKEIENKAKKEHEAKTKASNMADTKTGTNTDNKEQTKETK